MGHLQILLTRASKRANIERAVNQYQKRLDAAKRDLEHVIGTMAMFEASGDLKAVGAHHAIVRMFRRGEMFAAIKVALDAAPCALDTRELAAVALRAKGLDDSDAVMRKAVMAIRLSKAFGGGAALWLKLQMNYDLAQIARDADSIKVRRVAPVPEPA